MSFSESFLISLSPNGLASPQRLYEQFGEKLKGNWDNSTSVGTLNGRFLNYHDPLQNPLELNNPFLAMLRWILNSIA